MEAIQSEIRGVRLKLVTHPDLFSPKRVDAGTMAMLECVDFTPEDKVLDLGCGCGVVGIYAAQIVGAANVFMVDVNPIAVEIAQQNAATNGVPGVSVSHSEGFRNLQASGFTRILCNPPYHTDFAVAKHFILKGFNRLVIGGEMWFVTKRDKWYRNKLTAVFGGVESRQVNSYFVFRAEKKRDKYARKM